MTTIRSTLLLAVAAVTLAICPASWAQSPPEEPQAPAKPIKPIEDPLPPVSIQFPGGTVGEYVEALSRATDHANFVVTSTDALDVPLPPIQLDSVAVQAAAGLINGVFQTPDGGEMGIEVTTISPPQGDQKPVFRVTAERRGRGRSPHNDVYVWSVAGLLGENVRAEDMLTAVETAVGLLGGQHGTAEIRFHQATGLLIAHGTDPQLKAIDRVVDGMYATHSRQNAMLKAEADKAKEDQVAELTAQLRQKDLRIHELEVKVSKLSEK